MTHKKSIKSLREGSVKSSRISFMEFAMNAFIVLLLFYLFFQLIFVFVFSHQCKSELIVEHITNNSLIEPRFKRALYFT